uniref:Laminin EGF-like domain-containing protein n=1 Tax=Macrostomum lignano TaxID=282301 RepID=A0A1I8ICK4_9PLAT
LRLRHPRLEGVPEVPQRPVHSELAQTLHLQAQRRWPPLPALPPGFWDLSSDNPEGCQSCNCTAEGVAGELADCDLETGRCTCKPLAVGSGCSRCPSGSRDLAAGRWLGCLPCGCDTAGSLGPNCVAAPDGVGSVCACLNDSVAGRLCDRPASEHFWPGLGQHRIEFETSARIP